MLGKIIKHSVTPYTIVGIVLLALFVTDTYFQTTQEHFWHVFWFCNATIFFLAIGFFLRNSWIITGALIGSILVQLPWILDFLARLLFGYELFGFTSYMWTYGFDSIRFYVELDHMIAIPISLYGVYKLGVHIKGWMFTVLFSIFIMSFSYVFSPVGDNINCVFSSCFNDDPSIYKQSIWLLIFKLFPIWIGTYLLNEILLWGRDRWRERRLKNKHIA